MSHQENDLIISPGCKLKIEYRATRPRRQSEGSCHAELVTVVTTFRGLNRFSSVGLYFSQSA